MNYDINDLSNKNAATTYDQNDITLEVVWSGSLEKQKLAPGLSHVTYAGGSTPLGVLVAAVVARETGMGSQHFRPMPPKPLRPHSPGFVSPSVG